MSDEDRDDSQPRRLLYEMQKRLETVRRRVRREQAFTDVSENAHLQLAEAIVEYHDMLYKYRSEQAVSDEFPEIPDIRERMGETAYIMQQAPGDTDNQRPVKRPALLELSTQRLLDAARELEDVTLTLGFAPSANAETTHRTEIDDDLIQEVEEWRQTNLED